MPDRDIFDKKVQRRWRTAARLVFLKDDEQLISETLMRALASSLQSDGFPGIDLVAAIGAEALCGPGGIDARREARERLFDMELNDRSIMARECVLRLLTDPSDLNVSMVDRLEPEKVRLAIMCRILIDFAHRQIAPGALLVQLVEYDGMSLTRYQECETRARQLLAQHARLGELAAQLLRDPRGQEVKVPRSKVQKLPQEALVHMALGQ